MHRSGSGPTDERAAPFSPECVTAAFARERTGRKCCLARYGYAKAVVLGRFIPVVRTVLNPVAGALGVPASTFTVWQVIGGLAWSQSLVLGGYWPGGSVRHPDAYLVPAVAAAVTGSLVPVAPEMLRGCRTERGQETLRGTKPLRP
ncbi:DedA family protein [Streptomyces sp. NPDC101225]|uniref:DedA family protein n=1 Tax=Streptomyces sp. NPDC101225 TaxID=3366135 RepID=UPI003826FBEE